MKPLRREPTRKASQLRQAERGPFFITPHAAERFKSRFAPGYTLSHCLKEAKVLSLQARKLSLRTAMDDEVWEAGEVWFIVKNEGRRGRTCTTIVKKVVVLRDDIVQLEEGE
jgi:hypothetical protein